jgi:hypothetical protein
VISAAVALAIAAMMTSIFAFRFRFAKRPAVLAGYFALFLGIEWIAGRYFLPPEALGIEVAVVCGAIALLFAGATVLTERLEKSDGRSD